MTRRFGYRAAIAAAAGVIVGLCGARGASAAAVVQYTFDSYTVPTSPGNAAIGAFSGPAADTGTGTFSAFHTGNSTYSTPVGNGTAKSFSSNTWTTNDYYQFTSPGFTGLQVEFDQTSSSTGPGTFQLEYSTDGTNFTIPAADAYTLNKAISFGLNNMVTTSPPRFMFDFTGFTDIETAATVTFRLVDTAAPSSASGSDRVDTVTVGTNLPAPTPAPEPATAGVAVIVGGLLLKRRGR